MDITKRHQYIPDKFNAGNSINISEAYNEPNEASKDKKTLKRYFATALLLLIKRKYAIALIVSVVPPYTHFLALGLLRPL